jgi:hypothetical protein
MVRVMAPVQAAPGARVVVVPSTVTVRDLPGGGTRTVASAARLSAVLCRRTDAVPGRAPGLEAMLPMRARLGHVLLSEESSYVNGAEITVDGGYAAHGG